MGDVKYDREQDSDDELENEQGDRELPTIADMNK